MAQSFVPHAAHDISLTHSSLTSWRLAFFIKRSTSALVQYWAIRGSIWSNTIDRKCWNENVRDRRKYSIRLRPHRRSSQSAPAGRIEIACTHDTGIHLNKTFLAGSNAKSNHSLFSRP